MSETDLINALRALLEASKDVEKQVHRHSRLETHGAQLHAAIAQAERVLALTQREEQLRRSNKFRERPSYSILLPAVGETGKPSNAKPKRREARRPPKNRKVSR